MYSKRIVTQMSCSNMFSSFLYLHAQLYYGSSAPGLGGLCLFSYSSPWKRKSKKWFALNPLSPLCNEFLFKGYLELCTYPFFIERLVIPQAVSLCQSFWRWVTSCDTHSPESKEKDIIFLVISRLHCDSVLGFYLPHTPCDSATLRLWHNQEMTIVVIEDW